MTCSPGGHLLDLMPEGRDEDGYAFSMAWVRHHDRYDASCTVDPTAGYLVPNTVAGGACCCSNR